MADRAVKREPEAIPNSGPKDSRDRERDRDSKEYYPTRESRDYPRDPARNQSSQENKIYVGGINFSASKDDIARVFSKAGRVVHVQLVVDQETHRSKGYAFVTFADEDSYQYALNKMNGVSIMGKSVVVNKALNAEEKAQWERERGIVRDREPGGGRYGPPRMHNSDKVHFDKPPGPKAKGYRVTIMGLPESYTWRELKDFLRTATNAQPTYTNVERPGIGVGEWATLAERANAIRLLDGSTLEGVRVRCEPREEDHGVDDDWAGGAGGRDGAGGNGGRDGAGAANSYYPSGRGDNGRAAEPGYDRREERGRGGGSYQERHYASFSNDGAGGRGRSGSYDDRYGDKYASRGEGGSRPGSYDAVGASGRYPGGGGGRYDGGGRPEVGSGGRYEGGTGGAARYEGGGAAAGRYDGGGGGASRYESDGRTGRYDPGPGSAPGRYEGGGAAVRYDSGAGYGPREGRYESGGGGYGSRDNGREPGGYGGGYPPRDPGGYPPRDPGYAPREPAGRDAGYARNGSGGDAAGYGGGYGSREGGSGRGSGALYETPYPDKYANRGGGYAGDGGRGARYDDAGYEGSRRDQGHVPPPSKDLYGPPKDTYGTTPGGSRAAAGYPPRDAPYTSGPRGGGGSESFGRYPGYDTHRGERDPGYDRRGDGYGGYDHGGGAGSGYKSGSGGYAGGAGRPPAGSGGPPGSAGGSRPPARGGYGVDGAYEGTGRGGPDRNYPGTGRALGGHERSAPY